MWLLFDVAVAVMAVDRVEGGSEGEGGEWRRRHLKIDTGASRPVTDYNRTIPINRTRTVDTATVAVPNKPPPQISDSLFAWLPPLVIV